MADETPQENPLDTWRQFITDSERQWNGFFREVLGTEAFSSSMNAFVESSLTIQRMVADQLERFYETFNIPSHTDLVALGERMKMIEDSLARIETMVSAKAPAGAARAAVARKRPPRTKRPASVNGASSSRR